jgi:hypothetical protein
MSKYKTKTEMEIRIEHSESEGQYLKVCQADNCIGLYAMNSKHDGLVLGCLEIDPDMAPMLIKAIQRVADCINDNNDNKE